MNILKRLLLAVAGLFVLSHTVQAHYDPDIGRWINRDPIAEAGGKGIKTLQIIDGPGAIILTQDGKIGAGNEKAIDPANRDYHVHLYCCIFLPVFS